MVINEQALNALLHINGIQFEAHERVPFFVVDENSVLVESEDSDPINVIESFYTETHNGITYVKMDSTGRSFGKLNGAEPTYNSAMSETRQALWVEQFGYAISANKMMEIRQMDYIMSDVDTFREYNKSEIDKIKHDTTFIFDMKSNATGVEKDYTFGLVAVQKLGTSIEYALSIGEETVPWHDNSIGKHVDYSIPQAQKLLVDLNAEIAEQTAVLDVFSERNNNATSIDELSAVFTDPFTEEENAYITSMVERYII